jgi:hypothetical protein
LITKREINWALEPYGFSVGTIYSDRRKGYIRHKAMLWGDGTWPSSKAFDVMKGLGLDVNFYKGGYIVWTSSEEASVRREARRYSLESSNDLESLKRDIDMRRPYRRLIESLEGDWEDLDFEEE